MSQKKLVMLVIMDGYGIRENPDGNAIVAAKKPNLDKLFQKYPHTMIGASGEAVGLPDGQMGNSEVGHLNIGAGRVVFQSLTRVNIACRDQILDQVEAIDKAIHHAIENHSSLHIMGLMSDGGVHSHIDHIVYLMNKAVQRGVKKVYVHSFLDGRDVPPTSAKTYLTYLDQQRVKGVELGVVSGRYYAMDRDKNYDRIQLAYDALVRGEAPIKGLLEGIDESYQNNITDEFVKPYIVTKDSHIKENDAVIYANFRPDRAIQMSIAITNPTYARSEKSVLKNYIEFKNIDLNSQFFDTLREDYNGVEFDRWFKKKAAQKEKAYTFENEDGMKGFLYLKTEDKNEKYDDISPKFPSKNRLKVGTFKIISTGFRLGERFLKIIFDNARKFNVDEIYVTLFENKREEVKQLKRFMESWGFRKWGYKDNGEAVLEKSMIDLSLIHI